MHPIWVSEASVLAAYCLFTHSSPKTGGLTRWFFSTLTALRPQTSMTKCEVSLFLRFLFKGAAIIETPRRNVYSCYRFQERTSSGRYLWNIAATRSHPSSFLKPLIFQGQLHVQGNQLIRKKNDTFWFHCHLGAMGSPRISSICVTCSYGDLEKMITSSI